MRALRILSAAAAFALVAGGCPESDPTDLPSTDLFGGGVPSDLDFGFGPLDGDGNDPFSIDDLLTGLGDGAGDSTGASDPNLPRDAQTDPTDDAPDEDDAPDDDGDDPAGDHAPDDGAGDDSPDDPGSDDGSSDDPGPDDGDGAGDDDSDPDSDDSGDGDPNSPDPNEPPPAPMLAGGYSGTVTCLTRQAIVSDPNAIELPEEAAVNPAAVSLEFSAEGVADGIWIPPFIDGPDGFAEATEVGQLVVLHDTYNAMNVTTRVEVLEIDNDGSTARMAADVTMRFRDEFGALLIRVDGIVTQVVAAQQDGTAAYSSDVWYDAKLWTPDHSILFDVVEVHDCDGVLD